jgi:cytochrome c oxidase cbb3-type subunit 2
MHALNTVGHGYTEQEISEAPAALEGKTELEAVIAYLQSLGIHAPKS